MEQIFFQEGLKNFLRVRVFREASKGFISTRDLKI